MMHVEFTMLMSAVLDHEAPPADMLRLQQHLDGCPACAQTWARWRSVDSLFAGAPRVTPHAGFAFRVSERLAERRRRSQRRRLLGGGLIVAWAGIIAFMWLIMVGSVAWGYTHPAGIASLLAWCSQAGSGVASIGRSVLHGAFQGLSGWQFWAGLVSYLGLTAIVAAGWLWLMSHKSGWADVLTVANDASL